MDHDTCYADFLQVKRQQFAYHIRSGFASMMSILATAFFACTQGDGSAFSGNEDLNGGGSVSGSFDSENAAVSMMFDELKTESWWLIHTGAA